MNESCFNQSLANLGMSEQFQQESLSRYLTSFGGTQMGQGIQSTSSGLTRTGTSHHPNIRKLLALWSSMPFAQGVHGKVRKKARTMVWYALLSGSLVSLKTLMAISERCMRLVVSKHGWPTALK